MGEGQNRLVGLRVRLALRHPYLASALMRLPVREVDGLAWCTTMATDGYHVFFNPNWIRRLSDEELGGVLAHELLHVVFGHIDRRGAREPRLWNIACDHAVNLILRTQGFTLPKDALEGTCFTGMSAEAIYSRLHQERALKSDGQKDGSSGAFDPAAGPPGGEDLVSPSDPRVAAVADRDAPDAQERRELRQRLGSEMKSQLRGNLAGYLFTEIECGTGARIDWRVLLRAWLTERVKTDWCLFPYAKKHLWRGLYLPSVGAPAPGHMLFAIDTSGSMRDADLTYIGSEVSHLREQFPSRLTLVQCDAGIQKIDEYEADDDATLPSRMTFLGRGGTNFRPVFELLNTSHQDVSLVVFATDGFGSFPDAPPRCPCLWVVTEYGAQDAAFPFGAVVRVAD